MLRLERADPPPDFFTRRPRVINMGSHKLTELLERPTTTMTEIMGDFAARDASLSTA
jgi:hypothetical protein